MTPNTHRALVVLFGLIAFCTALASGGLTWQSVLMALVSGCNAAIAKLTPSRSEPTPPASQL